MSEILPRIASKTPFKTEVKKDQKYSWCSCGYSKIEPFCDGSHKEFKDIDGNSIMKSVKFFPNQDQTVNFCGCKQTKTPPFCDGSHLKL
jgi:CDGSH iron-sulfur domain-containing protein 3